MASRSKDLYAVLGVARDVDADALKKAYRKLAREHHPDANPDAEAQAEARFKDISEAHTVLSDPTRRALYDEFGELALDPQFDAKAAEQARARAGFGFPPGADFGYGSEAPDGAGFGAQFADGLEDWLGDLLFGNAQASAPRRGIDVDADLEIDFRTAALGGTKQIDVRRPGPDGEPHVESLQVTIPAGVDDGSRIRLAGKGGISAASGRRGDLLISLRVRRDRVFRREGRDLYLDLPIGVADAALGADIDVPTLDGRAKLHVPAGTDGGSTLRLRGKGIPAARQKPAGDLYVQLRVRVPRDLDDAARATIEGLDDGGAAEARGEWTR